MFGQGQQCGDGQGWGGGGEGGYGGINGDDVTWGGDHTIWCTDNVLWNFTPEPCIISINVTPTNSIKTRVRGEQALYSKHCSGVKIVSALVGQ